MRPFLLFSLLLVCLFPLPATAEQPFTQLVGNLTPAPVKNTDVLQVPYITWGGDMVTFFANGGLETRDGSIFAGQNLKLKLVPGDDFLQQVKDYVSGKSPFLRGTFRMIGLASEVIARSPETKGVVIMQLTWSAGDHLVARSDVKTIADLKGRKVCLQQRGPHVGMLDDILKTAGLSWDDIRLEWAEDLTATAKSPAELFRANPDIAACFVITPDMIGLSGGLQNVGSGAEGTVKGARVLVSTAELSRSIADVYVCRKDFYDAHKDQVVRFVSGYLKAAEAVVALKKQYESKGSPEYMKLLQMTQDIYGKETIPTLEEDAHGLLADCSLVGYPGNVSFFTDPNNLNGFAAFNKSALDLATGRGYASLRAALLPNDFDWKSADLTQGLVHTEVKRSEKFQAEALQKEIEELSSGGEMDSRTIYSFTVEFQPNQNEFSIDQYGTEFQKVVEMASKYANAVVAIRGHADPTKTLLELVKAGMGKGVLKRGGLSGNWSYSLNGKPLDLESTGDVIRAVEAGVFDGHPEHKPREVMQAALNLSRKRAEAVRESVIAYAKTKNVPLDASQIQPVGVGIREPFIAKPANMDEAKKNMRVEFRLIRVTAEAASSSDFDF